MEVLQQHPGLHLCEMQHIHCHSLGAGSSTWLFRVAMGCSGASVCVLAPGEGVRAAGPPSRMGLHGVRSHVVPWTRGTGRTNPQRVTWCHRCFSVIQPDRGGWASFMQAKVASNPEANPIPCRVSSPVLALPTASVQGRWRCRKQIPHWCCQHQAKEVEVQL